jgi:hypothetical protein
MAISRSIKWGLFDEELLSFYGLSLSKPQEIRPTFGSGIRIIQLTNSDGSGERPVLFIPEKETCPTLLNLASYFGYVDWKIVETLREKAIDPRIIHALLKFGQKDFVTKHIDPLRVYVQEQFQMYFRCIPASSTEATLMTGELIHVVGPLVLCLLPKSPEIAQRHGSTQEEIKSLAGQVMWLVHRLCDIGCIKSPTQLIEATTGWVEHIDPLTMLLKQEKIGKTHPHLITEESRQALLPNFAPRVLRLAENATNTEKAG